MLYGQHGQGKTCFWSCYTELIFIICCSMVTAQLTVFGLVMLLETLTCRFSSLLISIYFLQKSYDRREYGLGLKDRE